MQLSPGSNEPQKPEVNDLISSNELLHSGHEVSLTGKDAKIMLGALFLVAVDGFATGDLMGARRFHRVDD